MNTLSLLTFTPILAASVAALHPVTRHNARRIALLSSFAVAGLTLYALYSFTPEYGLQMVEKQPWIEAYGIFYHLGADAFSLAVMGVMALIMPLLFLSLPTQSRKGMVVALLYTQGGITGALFSLDLILFYLFWELMLLPIFIMIGLYGTEDRQRIAIRLTLYTIFGSIAMLFSILTLGVYLYGSNGSFHFDLFAIANMLQSEPAKGWVVTGFLIAFLIKVPVFGLHGWLKSSYIAAPTPTLILLSALMAKLGIYALYRFVFTLFAAQLTLLAPYMVALGLFGMLYFGLLALRQSHLRALIAYASASHMSLILAGLFTLNLYGMSGGLYLILSHALASTGVLILTAHLYAQSKSQMIADYSGLASRTPWLATLLALYLLSLVGIPGSSGFVAELLIILGTFTYAPIAGFAAALTLLIAMLFILKILRQMLFGPPNATAERMQEPPALLAAGLTLLLVLIFLMGLYPAPFLGVMEPSLLESGALR